MKIAVFGSSVQQKFIPVLQEFFSYLHENQVEIYLYAPFHDFLAEELKYVPPFSGLYTSHTDFTGDARFIFSIGGDGTFLHSFRTIRHFDIPVVGINSGRMGFLADISKGEVIEALSNLLDGNYVVTERSLLEVSFNGAPNFEFNYALNEMTVLKTDTSSMINIQAWANGDFLNSIWADGLIIATPTGSTAYSLSVGGPILTPDSENFVITPIAPHNLTVRPIVIPDHYKVLLKVEGRGNQYLTSLDSQSVNVNLSTTISIKKAGFKLKTLHLPGQTFFHTLRSKLMWGADKRN